MHTECRDGTKLRGADDKLGGCAAFHLDRLKKWADRNLMELDKMKYLFLHMRRNNSAMSVNAWREDAKRTEPCSFQGCPSIEWEARSTNWNSGGSVWPHGKTPLLWKWLSTSTSFPERYCGFFVLRDIPTWWQTAPRELLWLFWTRALEEKCYKLYFTCPLYCRKSDIFNQNL